MAVGGWYYSLAGERKGPVEDGALRALVDAGVIQGETLVWREGMNDWEPAFRHVSGVVPSIPRPTSPSQVSFSSRGSVAHGRDYHAQVGMGEALGLFFSNYFNFSGRSNRGEYWWAALATVIVAFVLGFIDGAAFRNTEVQPLSTIWGLATFIPSIAIGVRRLHDTDRTGWWILAPTALIILGIILTLAAMQAGSGPELAIVAWIAAAITGIVLFVWFCQRGTSGPNRFG